MGDRMKRALPMLLLMLAAMFVLVGVPALQEWRFSARVLGAPAPDFALTDVGGQTVRLSELKGKPIVLAFWAGG